MVVDGNLLIGDARVSHQFVEVNTVGSAQSPGVDAETSVASDGSLFDTVPVPGVRLGRNAHDMDACMIPGASANPAVFVVELAPPTPARWRSAACTWPSPRLAGTGVQVRWLSALTIPERSRSLYFIAAADRLAGAEPTRRDRHDTPPVPAAVH
jgi:hypothetical protein